MAQAIHCDAVGCDQLADALVTNLDNGDTLAWCANHYAEQARALVAQLDQAEADATDAEAMRRLAGEPAPEPAVEVAPAPEIRPQPGDAPESEPTVTPAHVVPRGASTGRRRHEARKRAHAAELAAVAAEPTPGPDDPDDEPSDEPVAQGLA